MPSGTTHATISVAATPFVFYTALEATSSVPLALCAAVGCGVVGILLTPDLDQETRGWAENKLLRNRNIVVAFIGGIHYAIWYPYGKLIPHRHFLSHLPVVGTALRLAYLATVILFFYWIAVAGLQWDMPLPSFDSVKWYVGAVVYGLAVSDTLHWAADVIVSGLKRYSKQRNSKNRQRRYQRK